MLWFLGFVAIFALGGISGVLLAIPPVDFQLHNSLFLVAHFHSTVVGGVLFGIFAGLNYWFPKIAGFRLNERIGRYAVWCWIIGFFVAFMPLYVLGLMGATRRLDHYDASTGWQPFFIMSLIGGIIIMIGTALQVVQIITSFFQKRRLLDTTGDPWDGRTLEWSVPSPAPAYNFAVIPEVTSADAYHEMKKHGIIKPKFQDIHIPKNTGAGIYISIFAFLAGFGFVWEIVWLPVVSIIGIIICLISKTFQEDSEYTIPAETVEKMENDLIARNRALYRPSDEEEMGLIEFIKVVLKWALGILRRKS
jgi:cytochrome o ubiquinol oxidase subunit 1